MNEMPTDRELFELHCPGCGDDAIERPDGVWVHTFDGEPLEVCGSDQPVEHARTSSGQVA
jgi:hypothetical protein